ncbi:N-6 DNA methylase [Lactobacillus sp. LL6]|uniref:N-6 DNA methylase n=1 Tax=Lactobacillus sp. LL6 TaxID=2596827 RepID=UPI001186EFE1|nr:N-6 DNA methylase [Lactobacillus sp. LL6]TSO25688.1 N-6 DNA methylase [Lactobacillus sp. LL6]
MNEIEDLLSEIRENDKNLVWLIIAQLMISLQTLNKSIENKEQFINAIDSFVDYQNYDLISQIKNQIYKKIAILDKTKFSEIINLLCCQSNAELINLLKEVEDLIYPRTVHIKTLPDNFLKLLVKLADIKTKDKILDPSGNTSNIWKAILRNNHNQELTLEGPNLFINASIYIIGKYLKANNLIIYQGNSLENPKYVSDGKLQLFNKILSLPPLRERINIDYAKDKYNRFRYGKLLKTRIDMAYLSNIVSSLNEKGKAIVVVPDGILFRESNDKIIRRNLVKQDWVESVISFTGNILTNASIPINILIINKNKTKLKGKILFIDAKQKGWTEKNRFITSISEVGKKKIIQLYENPKNEAGISQIICNSEFNGSLIVKDYVLPVETKINGVTYKIDYNNLEKIETNSLKNMVSLLPGYNVLKGDDSDKGNVLVIKGTDLSGGKIKYNKNLNKISIKKTANKYLLQPNDILLTIKGDVGKVGIVSKDAPFPMIATANLLILRPNGKVDPYWLKLYLESPLGQFYIKRKINSSISVVSISLRDIKNLPIPVVDIEKQRRISINYKKKKNMLDKKLEEIDKQYKQLKSNLNQQLDINSILERK